MDVTNEMESRLRFDAEGSQRSEGILSIFSSSP